MNKQYMKGLQNGKKGYLMKMCTMTMTSTVQGTETKDTKMDSWIFT